MYYEFVKFWYKLYLIHVMNIEYAMHEFSELFKVEYARKHATVSVG